MKFMREFVKKYKVIIIKISSWFSSDRLRASFGWFFVEMGLSVTSRWQNVPSFPWRTNLETNEPNRSKWGCWIRLFLFLVKWGTLVILSVSLIRGRHYIYLLRGPGAAVVFFFVWGGAFRLWLADVRNYVGDFESQTTDLGKTLALIRVTTILAPIRAWGLFEILGPLLALLRG